MLKPEKAGEKFINVFPVIPIMEGIRENPMESKNNGSAGSDKVLWIVLSALGVMALAVVAGILIFYKPVQSGRARFTSDPIKTETPVAVTTPAETPSDTPSGEEGTSFDAVEWARGDGKTPELENDGSVEGQSGTDSEIVINWAPEGSEQKTSVQIRPEKKPVMKTVDKRTQPAARQVEQDTLTRKEEAIVWWIQVASFSSAFKAESVSESLYMKGIPTTIQTQVVNGKTWYRIRVGAFGSQEEADAFKTKLADLPEIADPLVIKGKIVREVPVN